MSFWQYSSPPGKRNTMPGWCRAVKLAVLSSKSDSTNMLMIEFWVQFLAAVSSVQFAASADWEVPGWFPSK